MSDGSAPSGGSGARRLPGWLVLLGLVVLIGALGTVIWLGVR